MDERTSISYYSKLKPQHVSWLWYPYVPFGKITLIQGDPGEGKSTLALRLIADASSRGVSPMGVKFTHALSSIYQCSEDGAADTIKPRLMMFGADCSKIAYIQEEMGDEPLTLDDNRLEKKNDNDRDWAYVPGHHVGIYALR